jgi:hypothetical protein
MEETHGITHCLKITGNIPVKLPPFSWGEEHFSTHPSPLRGRVRGLIGKGGRVINNQQSLKNKC